MLLYMMSLFCILYWFSWIIDACNFRCLFMGDFNRDFNRRHRGPPSGPPHQRNSQWGEPEYWQADQYQHPRPSWREEQYRRGPPPDREPHYWREPSPQFYRSNRGRHYDRNYHRPPRQTSVVIDLGRESHSDQQQEPTGHHSAKTMGRKKGQSSRTTKAPEQDNDSASQVCIFTSFICAHYSHMYWLLLLIILFFYVYRK